MRIQTAFFIASTMLATACNNLSAANDVPALIAQSSIQSRAELLRVVSVALNGVQVMLADDALTRNSLLTIERKPHRDLQGRQATGRQLGRPEQFRLVLNRSDCILVNLRNDERWQLTETSCVPE